MPRNSPKVSDWLPSLSACSGVRMNFDNQSIGADHGGSARQHRNQAANARGVAGIHDDGKVRNGLQYRHGCDVERVASRGFKSANAALAQDDVADSRPSR